MTTYYRKKGTTPMEPWTSFMDPSDMEGVSISDDDRANGSPQVGDMIAWDDTNPDDAWLINPTFFAKNYEVASTPQGERPEPRPLPESFLDSGTGKA